MKKIEHINALFRRWQIEKMLLEAARLARVSIKTFMTTAVYEKTKKIIITHGGIVLSDKERDRFLLFLEKPIAPNTKLKKAMQRYLSKE